MNSKRLKILIALLCVLCLIVAVVLVKCKNNGVSHSDIYAEESDFESYPEYWNSFNDESDNVKSETEIITGDPTIDSSIGSSSSSGPTDDDKPITDDFVSSEDETTNSSGGQEDSGDDDGETSSSQESTPYEGPIYILN